MQIQQQQSQITSLQSSKSILQKAMLEQLSEARQQLKTEQVCVVTWADCSLLTRSTSITQEKRQHIEEGNAEELRPHSRVSMFSICPVSILSADLPERAVPPKGAASRSLQQHPRCSVLLRFRWRVPFKRCAGRGSPRCFADADGSGAVIIKGLV